MIQPIAMQSCLRATFDKPHYYASGIRAVLVNGRLALDGDRQTGALTGRVLRKKTGSEVFTNI